MASFLGFEPHGISRMTVEHVLWAHAEEAAFQWGQRARAVQSPKYALKDLADLDNRVDAHLDGLRVAGEQAWEKCEEGLANGPGEVFAATALALRQEPKRTALYLELVLAQVEADPVLRPALISGLGFSPWLRLQVHAQSWLESDDPLLKALGIAAFRVHRHTPPEADLRRSLSVTDKLVRQETIRFIGELGLERLGRELPFLPEDPAPLRFLWARSLLLLKRPGPAMPVLRALAEADGPGGPSAAGLFVRRLDERSALEWIRKNLRQPDRRRLAVLAIGAAGYTGLVDELLSLMEDDTVARLAGFAFTLLTGADLEFLDLDREPPPSSDESEDENGIAENPDEELPWPHAVRVQDWWAHNKADFRSGQRYLMGQPIERSSLKRVLASGKQPHRRAAALEQALSDARTPLYPTSKPGREQARELLGWP